MPFPNRPARSRTIIDFDRHLKWQLRSALTAEEILLESEYIVEQPLSNAEDCAVVRSHLHQEQGNEHVSRLENIVIKQHRRRRERNDSENVQAKFRGLVQQYYLGPFFLLVLIVKT